MTIMKSRLDSVQQRADGDFHQDADSLVDRINSEIVRQGVPASAVESDWHTATGAAQNGTRLFEIGPTGCKVFGFAGAKHDGTIKGAVAMLGSLLDEAGRDD